MENIKFRLGKLCDAKQVAYVHYHIRDKYNQGFFAQVNYKFLVQYYKIMLNDPNEVIICAEDYNNNIVGFSSGCLDSNKQFNAMRKKKYIFIFPLIASAICNPYIIKSAIDRYRSTKGKSKNNYITAHGARAEYWGWLPNRDDSDMSLKMQEVWLLIMKILGAQEIHFEVDKVNKRIYKFHKINGAKELNSHILPDGRERVDLVYDLRTYNFKI